MKTLFVPCVFSRTQSAGFSVSLHREAGGQVDHSTLQAGPEGPDLALLEGPDLYSERTLGDVVDSVEDGDNVMARYWWFVDYLVGPLVDLLNTAWQLRSSRTNECNLINTKAKSSNMSLYETGNWRELKRRQWNMYVFFQDFFFISDLSRLSNQEL